MHYRFLKNKTLWLPNYSTTLTLQNHSMAPKGMFKYDRTENPPKKCEDRIGFKKKCENGGGGLKIPQNSVRSYLNCP